MKHPWPPGTLTCAMIHDYKPINHPINHMALVVSYIKYFKDINLHEYFVLSDGRIQTWAFAGENKNRNILK